MSRLTTRMTRLFAARPDETALAGGRPPAMALRNLAAGLSRPCLRPGWLPRAVSVHSALYREARAGLRYFGEATVEATGAPPLRMLLHDDDMVAYVFFLFGKDSYEPLSLALFAGFAKRAGAGAVLDIGAFTGLFGLVAAASAPAATVRAFEPTPHLAARARLNAALNGLRNLKVETRAVSGGPGRARLTLYGADAATPGASLAAKPRGDFGAIEVETVTVDAVAARLSAPVRLIKLDTEGDEPAALAGAAETLRRDGPALIVEALSDEAAAEAIRLTAAAGYEARFIDERARRLIPVGAGFTLRGRGFGNFLHTRGAADAAAAEALAEAFRALPHRGREARRTG